MRAEISASYTRSTESPTGKWQAARLSTKQGPPQLLATSDIYVYIPYSVYLVASRIKHPPPRADFQADFLDNGESEENKKRNKKRRAVRLWTDLDEILRKPLPVFSLGAPPSAWLWRKATPNLVPGCVLSMLAVASSAAKNFSITGIILLLYPYTLFFVPV